MCKQVREASPRHVGEDLKEAKKRARWVSGPTGPGGGGAPAGAPNADTAHRRTLGQMGVCTLDKQPGGQSSMSNVSNGNGKR